MTSLCATSQAELKYNSAGDISESQFDAFMRSTKFDIAVDARIEEMLKDDMLFWEAFGPDAIQEPVVNGLFERSIAKLFLERDHKAIGKAFWNMAASYLRQCASSHVEENWGDYA